jgi:hypothetical protein
VLLHEGLSRSFAFVSVPWDMSKNRFIWHWRRRRKSWWLRLGVFKLWGYGVLVEMETMMHMLFLCVRCLMPCISGLGKRGWQHRWTVYLWYSLSTESHFLNVKIQVWPLLVFLVPNNGLVEDIVLRTRTFFKVKI